MGFLLDTDVLVDFLRGTDEARAWMDSHSRESFAIPGVVAMELVIGCRDKVALHGILKFLRTFEVLWPEAEEFEKAFGILAKLHLKCSIGIPDCIIAALAMKRSMCLLSFNDSHFRHVEGLEVRAPFERSG